MQIGIFSNGNRNNKVAKLSYDEDLKEIIVADRLGMTEAWMDTGVIKSRLHPSCRAGCAQAECCPRDNQSA